VFVLLINTTVGRGVLIDFYSFSKKSYDPFSSRKITFTDIMDCARAQNVQFQYGDILIVRSGFTEEYRKLNQDERDIMGRKTFEELKFAGLDRTPETVAFLHDNYFSAVGGDTPAFEVWPMDDPHHLHHLLLARWGVPIGELWDLDGLAELCQKHQRWEFFFSSSPANVQGNVMPLSEICCSPAN
jgi:kynurenine formamidase